MSICPLKLKVLDRLFATFAPFSKIQFPGNMMIPMPTATVKEATRKVPKRSSRDIPGSLVPSPDASTAKRFEF